MYHDGPTHWVEGWSVWSQGEAVKLTVGDKNWRVHCSSLWMLRILTLLTQIVLGKVSHTHLSHRSYHIQSTFSGLRKWTRKSSTSCIVSPVIHLLMLIPQWGIFLHGSKIWLIHSRLGFYEYHRMGTARWWNTVRLDTTRQWFCYCVPVLVSRFHQINLLICVSTKLSSYCVALVTSIGPESFYIAG